MAEAPSDPSAPYVPPAPSDIETGIPQIEEISKPANESMAQGESAPSGDESVTEPVAGAPVTNGKAEHVATETTAQPSEPIKATENTEMNDVEVPVEATAARPTFETPPATNGTPATSKRASVSGTTKKRSSAVPEHKSKKLNKKKSKPLTNLNAQPGEYYFARMKGHPPWPSVVCDEEMLPQSLLTTRPVTAALPDGSFKKAEYADGGKRAYERTFPVMFLHTNEFAWIPNTELTFLDTDSDAVKNPSEKGKSKTLLAAYEKASEANGLEHFKAMLSDHQKALQEDMAVQEERAAKKAEKAKKAAARKSYEAVAEENDEMDIDEDTGANKPKSKKRKKAAEDSDADEKPAKTPKTTTKLKLSTPKQPGEPAAKKKAAKPKTKATKSGSEEDGSTPKVEEKPLSPAALKEIKEKKVLYYRHKLQRGFLQRDTVPKAEEMKSMADFLSELEGYPDLEGSIIRVTKIHKVLKQMIKLEHIPLEEEFKFKDRSTKLLARWNDTLSADGNSDEKVEEKAEEKTAQKTEDKPAERNIEESTPTTNGEAKGIEEQVQKAEAAEASESEEEPAHKIGTTVEGAKEAGAQKAVDEIAEKPEKTAEEKQTDEPAIETAPAEEYKPPGEKSVQTTT
ncbi:MAG: hypothetical protein Q9217_003788 [Psora testacea]